MPVHYIQTEAEVKHGDMTKLAIKEITMTTDPSHHYVQGRVKVSYELSKTRSSSLLKMQLHDDGDSIDVFAFGTVAEHLAACCRNDTAIITGFSVEKPPQHSSSPHPCILVLEECETVTPTVWVLKSTSTSPGKMPTPPVTYMNLKDVKMGDVVNVYGVVKFLRPPQKTRGPDYSMFLSLIDPSLYENGQKLKCVLFSKEEECLPTANIGDVIRIHRLRVGQFGQELQGTYHPGQAWVHFPATSPDNPQASTNRFTFNPADKERVQRLLSWAKTISWDQTELGGTVPQGDIHPVQPASSTATPTVGLGTIQLKDIVPNAYFNLICQVVATAMIEKDVCSLVRVWDGTKTSLCVAQVDLGCVEVKQDARLVSEAQGLLYDVCLYDNHVQRATAIKPRDIIRLTNLRAARQKLVKDGTFQVLQTVELSLHRGSSFGRGVTILPHNCQEAVALRTFLESCEPLDFSMPLSGQDSQQSGKADSQQLSKADSQQLGKTDSQQSGKADSQQSGKADSQQSGKADSQQTHSVDLITSGNDDSVGRGNTDTERAQNSMTQDPQHKEFQSQQQGGGDKETGHPRCMLDTGTVMKEPHPHLPFTSLHEVLHHSVPYKFKVQARVSRYAPCPAFPAALLHLLCPRCYYRSPLRGTEEEQWSVSEGWPRNHSRNPRRQVERRKIAGSAQELQEQHTAPLRLCPQCAVQDCPQEMRCVMILKLLLRDGDSSLWTWLCKNEAVRFFNGIAPEEMLADPRAADAVQEYLDRICPSDSPFITHPLLECCLFSYHTLNGKIAFQMFDTVAM